MKKSFGRNSKSVPGLTIEKNFNNLNIKGKNSLKEG